MNVRMRDGQGPFWLVLWQDKLLAGTRYKAYMEYPSLDNGFATFILFLDQTCQHQRQRCRGRQALCCSRTNLDNHFVFSSK